ncbi:MAG TPA: Maf family protein [Sphingomonadales bacterium]|nr:Maf family protein [Sphingomonadales bacterium]
MAGTEIVLGSASPSRALVLRNAGVSFRIDPPGVDERHLTKEFLAKGASPVAIGFMLAAEKAKSVSLRARNHGCLIIGADQILVCGGKMFDKPATLEAAAVQLKALRGKRHTLLASLALFREGKQLHAITDEAHLAMRNFSDAFLDSYLAHAGERALSSVGAYQLESEGAQLFEAIEGDFFTILGLPLLPLLAYLRGAGLMAG